MCQFTVTGGKGPFWGGPIYQSYWLETPDMGKSIIPLLDPVIEALRRANIPYILHQEGVTEGVEYGPKGVLATLFAREGSKWAICGYPPIWGSPDL